MGARLLILEETIKAVAVKRHIDEKSLRDKLKNLGEELDKLTEGESWGVDWSNVFIIPW
jgi:S-adenosylhomocysteine hydrolase